MALLLAMYQKMKLIRQINQDTLKLTRISSRLDRVTKNIEKTQKRFTSLFAQLDQQAKMMQSNATIMFQNMAGVGMNNYANSLNPMGFTGMNGFVYNAMQQAFQNPLSIKNKDKEVVFSSEMGSELFERMYADYMNNGGQFPQAYEEAEDNTKKVIKDELGNPTYEGGYNHYEVQAFMQAMRSGQMQQQQAQMWVQNANQQYGNNVSIWLEAAKAQLEAEQDAALEPLSYEDTMLQLEKEQLDARLQRLRAEKESYDNLVSEEAKNTAPTFGLR